MPDPRHQLAAIMFTDIVGYTALMGKDEQKALALLKKNKEIHERLIAQYNGKLLKEIGDGILASFSSVSEAVYCAGAIQKGAKEEEISLRIGIHEGEVVFQDNDVFGDGVSIASRIQAEGDGGSIMISYSVYKDIRNKPGIEAESMGEIELKNVEEPEKLYKIKIGVINSEDNDSEPESRVESIQKRLFNQRKLIYGLGIIILLFAAYFFYNNVKTISGDPSNSSSNISIAVLPFLDMSPDKDQEYLADGIAEEIINALTKYPKLKIVGRTSSFSFKGKDTDIQTIGQKLNVNTILEGSVRKSGERIRITAQLIDVKSGFHIWSQQFESDLKDFFAIEDSVANLVALSIFPQSNFSDRNYNQVSKPKNYEAHDFFLKAKHISETKFQVSFKEADFKLSERMYNEALQLDPHYALAHAGLADLYNSYQISYALEDTNPEKEKYLNLQKKEIDLAYKLNPNHDFVNRVKGWVYLNFDESVEAFNSFRKAVQLNPKESWNFLALSFFLLDKGLYNEAFEAIQRAIDTDPLSTNAYFIRGIINMHSGRYDLALNDYQNSLEIDPDNLNGYYWLSVLYELMHEQKKAQEVWDKAKSKFPDFEATAPSKINIFLGAEGKSAFTEFHIIENLLRGNYQDALELLEENKNLLFNFHMLNNMPLFDSIREETVFKNLLEPKKSEYSSLKEIYGNMEFLKILDNQE